MTNKQLARRVNDYLRENISLEHMYIERDTRSDCDQGRYDCMKDLPESKPECTCRGQILSDSEKKSIIENGDATNLLFRFVAYSGEDTWFDTGMNLVISYELDGGSASLSFGQDVAEHIIKQSPEDLSKGLSYVLNAAVKEATDKIVRRYQK